MSMSADCTDNCKDIAPPPQLPSPSPPCTVHSEVIDGSWACQLLDRLLYPLHSAVFILFARWQFKQIRATFLLFCWHFAAAHTEHVGATVRQCDRETVQPNGRQKTRCSESRPRLLPRVVHVVQFDATPGRKRCIDSTNKNNNNATQQLRNVCSTSCTTSEPLPPTLPFYLACKLKSNTCCLIKRNTIYAIYSTIYISAMCAMCACKTSVDHGARFNEREKSCDSRL